MFDKCVDSLTCPPFRKSTRTVSLAIVSTNSIENLFKHQLGNGHGRDHDTVNMKISQSTLQSATLNPRQCKRRARSLR